MANEETARMEEMLDNLRADRYPLKEYRHIGKRGPRRIDGVHKASGSAEYTMDIQLPGMLHMRFLTSPYPHAAIKSMDTSQAAAMPGVRAILRYDDPELPEIVQFAELLKEARKADPAAPQQVILSPGQTFSPPA